MTAAQGPDAVADLLIPTWVRPPHREVSSAIGIVLRHVEETAAPASLGALDGLMWAVSAPEDRESPVMKQQRERTLLIAVSEVEVGGAIAVGRPYPDPQWWVERGIDPSRTLSRQLWEEVSVTGYMREYATGAARALGWLVGAQSSATCMVPRRDRDGSRISRRDLEVMAFDLFRLDYPDDEIRRRLAAPGIDPTDLLGSTASC